MSWRRLSLKPILFGFASTAVVSYGAYKYGQYKVSTNPPLDLFPNSSTTKLKSLDSPRYCTNISSIMPEIVDLGIEVLSSKPVIDHHTSNEFTTHKPLKEEVPQYVIYPTSTEQVSQVLKICNRERIPVVPFSGGTSIEGNFHSTRHGVVVDTSKMNKVLAINDNDLDVVVQCGVNWQKLNEDLEPYGLMFGTDCGPSGLISGMIATNASGINASRYGAMSANVISVTAVLADGTVVKTRRRPRKTSAGYNLTSLFVGSEGTLGIVTEAVVKVYPKPKSETVVVVQFPSISHATNTVAQVFRSGIQPSAIELLDANMIHCLNYGEYTSKPMLEAPTIFFKLGGINDTVVKESVKVLQSITKENDASNFKFAKNKQEQEELFSARKNALYAMTNWSRSEIDEDVKMWPTDIAVPLSQLSHVLTIINSWIKDSPFQSTIVAHAGDGNFHASIFYRDGQDDEAEKMVNKMVELGIANDGTATGEHGIGNSKRYFLQLELGENTIDMMRKIKMALDPNRILNPDKVFKIDPNDRGKH
ncbi:FAD linked oxidase, C-terminal domain family protein [Candida parapsilosis]|uniref:D-lactate dehydrogenase (cytochrome) n=2 Tax=Candida parapsilosis TaxID=5480 RepID=G8BB01_CANPC|nr:uncharacterized protein CPAR2_807740 [Candida parapsilosis]KAF6052119.1 FAD linked oxidase, C-terminal domain family protein [Candida parapsilosis]KAF6052384.1 FAD linked oxidase, C-terminal domain family protein [Candida parapsilosis]KAF6053921.1 FAD linked oxidase, C-terminal domain family protein [Candida parapsilosis]KAF6064160.1 FAD linked oxidase, C-terminal domain family protein [Candida parapsilosis]CCE42225.1 hypothetical protein CPAR2_807740 [Candida parapsilosis]